MIKRNKWWVLFVTASAVGLVFLDNTVMPVSLPTIQKELSFSTSGSIWVVNSYLLTLVTLMMIGGKMYDILGTRTTYFLGLSFFGVGSVMSGLSFVNWWLILGRVVQGLGGALLVPTTAALFMTIFPAGQRARAIGINTGVSSIFLMLGPVVGGFLTQYLSWRYIFWINIPVVIFALIMTSWLFSAQKRKGSFHFVGALPLCIAVIALVVALMEGGNWGWGSPLIITLFALVIPLVLLFIFLSRRSQYPLIDFKIFTTPFFKSGNVVIFCVQMVLMITVFWAIYFQKALYYSPSQAGLLVLSAVSPVILLAPLGGYLSDRFGPRLPISLGFSLVIFSMLWLSLTVHNHSLATLLIGLPFFGAGIPLTFTPAFTTALHHVSPQKLGVASGFTTSVRQLAATIGIALMGALFFGILARTNSYPQAFVAISFLAAGFAFLGLCATLAFLRKAH